LPWGWINETRRVMKLMFDACDTSEDLVAGNEIFEARTRSIGIIPAELGAAYGVSGSNLRASGVDWDLRRDKPYLVYPELDFRVWTHPGGDSYARYWVRLQETREAARMVLQLLDKMPSGPIMTKVPLIIKVPQGESWVETENPLGQMGYYVFSKGATGPFRVKIRSASFSNVSILPWLLRGVFVPDVITILGSLYFILGDIDRGPDPGGPASPRQRLTPRGARGNGSRFPTAIASMHCRRSSLPRPAVDSRRCGERRHRAGLLAADRPADGRRAGGRAHPGRHARLRLPVQDDELHAEPAGADGGRAIRVDAAAGRGRQVDP